MKKLNKNLSQDFRSRYRRRIDQGQTDPNSQLVSSQNFSDLFNRIKIDWNICKLSCKRLSNIQNNQCVTKHNKKPTISRSVSAYNVNSQYFKSSNIKESNTKESNFKISFGFNINETGSYLF